jgi:hypothetical protein
MAGKLSAGAQQELVFFEEVKKKVDRLHSLIEQCGVAKGKMQEGMMGPINRTAVDVQRLLMSKGYGVMADSANNIAMNAKRGGGIQMKMRAFRELINSIKAAIDTRMKMIVAEDKQAAEGH